jgi:hypothetical protein
MEAMERALRRESKKTKRKEGIIERIRYKSDKTGRKSHRLPVRGEASKAES